MLRRRRSVAEAGWWWMGQASLPLRMLLLRLLLTKRLQ
jgi:hypothetical protein